MKIGIPVSIPENTYQVAIVILILLFVVWLLHRISNRIKSLAKDSVYENFPFIKKSVDGFQTKLDYLSKRVDAIEDRIFNLEKNKTENI
jgi:hypothetical protein